MLRVVADLVPLFDSPYGARVILGGDLNVSQRHEGPEEPRPRGGRLRGDPLARPRRGQDARRRAAGVAPPTARAAAAGRAATSRTWGRAELDHLFVSPVARRPGDGAVRRRARPSRPACRTTCRSCSTSRSPTERTPHAWDEESFAEEIGRRHGSAARDGRREARQLGRPQGARAGGGRRRPHQDAHPLPDQRHHDRARAVVPGRPQPRAEGHPDDDLDPRRRRGRRAGSAACATRRSTRRRPATSCATRSTRWTASTSRPAR